MMHAEDARSRGICNGDLVRIFNDRGSTLARAEVAAASEGEGEVGRARPGVVNGLGVWWRKYGRDGTNVNQLTHQRLTDIGRAPAFYDCLVQVERAASAGADVAAAAG